MKYSEFIYKKAVEKAHEEYPTIVWARVVRVEELILNHMNFLFKQINDTMKPSRR